MRDAPRSPGDGEPGWMDKAAALHATAEATIDVPLTLGEIRALMASPDDISDEFPWDDGYGPPLTLEDATLAIDSAHQKLRKSASILA